MHPPFPRCSNQTNEKCYILEARLLTLKLLRNFSFYNLWNISYHIHLQTMLPFQPVVEFTAWFQWQMLQYCAKVMETKFGEFRSLFSQNFDCQTRFRAKFQGNIARYFRATNEKSLFRKFAEAKFCAGTNKLMSNETKQQIIYGKVTEM